MAWNLFWQFGELLKSAKFNAANVLFNAYACSCVLETMVLLKYLKKKEKPLQQLTLPTIQNGVDTSLTEKDLECANKNVSAILLSNDRVNEMRRGKYNSYTSKERSKVGQYAAMYSATSAARYVIYRSFFKRFK